MTKPGSARMMATLSEAFLMPATTLALILGVGCYNPNVAPGGLTCSASGKPCPDGFACGAGNRCFKSGTAGAGGTTGSGGMVGAGGVVGSGGMGGDGGMADLGGMGGISDVDGTGGAGGQPARKLGETCLITNEGQVNQSDNCAAGALCMSDCLTARCYQICQRDADCPQSACTRKGPNGSPLLCELPFVTCNPADATKEGCGQGLDCYLLSADASPAGGDRTVCDCSMPAVGAGEACSDSRGCFRGLVCPPPGSGPGASYCRRVCAPATGCSSGGTCYPFGANWGYCF